MEATGTERDPATRALTEAQGECKTAIVMLKCGVSAVEAERLLAQSKGNVRAALNADRTIRVE